MRLKNHLSVFQRLPTSHSAAMTVHLIAHTLSGLAFLLHSPLSISFVHHQYVFLESGPKNTPGILDFFSPLSLLSAGEPRVERACG